MSLFGDIANGVVGGFKTVLGIDDDPKPAAKAVGSVAPKPKPASETPTSYDSSTSGSGSTQSSGYADDLFRGAVERARAGSGSSSSQRTTPLPGGDTRSAPPSAEDTTPVPVVADGTPQADSRTQTQPEARSWNVSVWDSSAPTTDGRASYMGSAAELTGGGSDAAIAARNVSRGLDYYANTFGRNGIDEAGGGVSVVLNDDSRDANGNAIFHGNGGYYTTRDASGQLSEAIRWGDGIAYNHQRGGTVSQASMLHADDLTIHEMTHGIIKRETGSLGGTADEAGSVNEGFADVLAASATRDWRMGEGMYTDASTYRYMRNLADPNDRLAVHGLWTSMDTWRQQVAAGNAEEHYGSGIVSTAAARMQSRIGGEPGWQAIEQLFYNTIDGHQLGDLSFNAAAQGLRTTAASMWGADDYRTQVVDYELRIAGL